MAINCRHFLVYGNVQGVGFRAATEQQANNLQLKGWVRNLPDGRVEILAQGDDSALQTFQDWVAQGPRFAAVQTVTMQNLDVDAQLTCFEIR